MCGRYAFYSPAQAINELFDIEDSLTVEPSYNIAPTDYVPVVRQKDSRSQLSMIRWGLIPFWAKDLKIGARMINARAETLGEKPAFRNAFRKRRCLLPANGFFEWKKLDKKTKTPIYITNQDSSLLVFAGIWERWGKEDDIVESVSIITTEPNQLIEPIHNRMPVILEKDQFSQWLDPDADETTLNALLKPAKPDPMMFYPVSKAVNNPREKSAITIEAAG